MFSGLVYCLVFFSFFQNAFAEHGSKTWESAYMSVVVVNPTWPGYERPGFGAPLGTAPAGTAIYFAYHEKRTRFLITAAHVVRRSKSIEIVNSNKLNICHFITEYISWECSN